MHHPFVDGLSTFGRSPAIVFHGREFNYQELLAEIDDWSSFLDSGHVGRGTVVTLEGVNSLTMCAGLLALVSRGAIVVPLSITPEAARAELLDIAEVEVAITIEDGVRTSRPTGRTATHELYGRLRAAGHPGLVLFSSGTTGHSKASLLDFDRVLARYGPARRPQRILSFLNLDHIGGINTLLHTLSQGGTVVTVDVRTPDAVLATMERHQVEVLPTTPTFLNLLLISRAVERYSTEALRLITYGTEPMPLSTLTRLREALPGVHLKQTYGLSELGILSTRSRDDDSLWIKLGDAGFEHRIVDGILWIKSEMAMLGYLNATAPFDSEGFFNTQDMVAVDGDWVHILGRRSEIINVGGEKVYPAEIEDMLITVPNIADAVVSGVPSHVTGDVVKAVVRLVTDEDARAVQRRVRAFCASRLEAFKVPALIEVSMDEQHSTRFKKMRST